MKKRILSLVLAVVMVLCLVPAISMVSFAAEEDYSILPDDENKQHFLDVMAAYGDDTMPSAATINEKLNGYLAQNENWTTQQIAEYMATQLNVYFLDEITVSDGEGGTTTQKLYDDTLYNSMWEENVAIITDFLNNNAGKTQAAMEENMRTALFAQLLYIGGNKDNGYRAYSTRLSTNYLVYSACKSIEDMTDTDTFAQGYADAIWAKGAWTPEAPQDEASQKAYVKAAVLKIITDNSLTSVGTNQQGNQVLTRLVMAVDFRSAINLTTNTDVANQGNNSGFRYHVLSAYEEAMKMSNYGTNKVKDFYLNFTDVKLEGDAKFTDAETEKEKLGVILDYYFAPGAGNYGYYEDLWYDDGHLIFFVDTANLNNPYATTINSIPTSETDLTQVAVEPTHFAKAIIASPNGVYGTYMRPSSSGIRSHVKVVGGQNIGRYFTIGYNHTQNTQILTTEVDADGYLRVYGSTTTDTQFSSSTASGFSRFAGIFLGYSYTFAATWEKPCMHAQTSWANQPQYDYNYFLDNGMTMTADENGKYGGYTYQFNTRIDADYWLNNSNGTVSSLYSNLVATAGTPTLSDKYATNLGNNLYGATATGANSYSSLGAVIRIGSRYDATLNDGAGGYVPTYGRVYSHYNGTGAVNAAQTSDLGTYMSITTTASFTGNDKASSLDFMKIGNSVTSVRYQLAYAGDDDVFLPNPNEMHRSAAQGRNMYLSMAVQMQDKQMSSMRVYDVSLTQAQIEQNELADLFYEKGIDLSVYNSLSDDAKSKVMGDLGSADFDAITVDEINAVINAAAEKEGTYYGDYAHLWYDDGHLVSFVDLMDITDEQRATQLTGSTGTQSANWYYVGTTDVYAKDTRLLVGYSLNQHYNRVGGTVPFYYRRSYVRITGGQNAGDWYMITTSGTADSFAFPAVSGGFTDLGNVSSGSYGVGNRTGILLTKAFSDYEAGMYYHCALEDLEAESYLLGKEGGGNGFSIDAAVYMGTPVSINHNMVFVSVSDFAQSSVTEGVFSETQNNNPNKQTEAYGIMTGLAYPSKDGVALGYYGQMNLGYVGRFGDNGAAPKFLDSSAHVTSAFSFETQNLYNLSMSIFADDQTSGAVKFTTVNSTHQKAMAAAEGYPSYGAYANLATTMVTIAPQSYYYYFRVYDVAITAEQARQNHFADLMYYNKIDTAKYDALSDNDKMTLWAWATDYMLSDATAKAAIEAKIDALAEASTELVNFKGFQARVSKNVGVRSVFYLDQSAIADAGVTVKAYGAIAGTAVPGADFDSFTISYDAENGVTVSSNARMTASTDEGFMLIADAEKEFILGSAENLDNYTMFAYTVDFINGSIDRNGNITGESMIDTLKDTEMFFRAFAVVEYKGATYIHYVDGASANYNNSSVSLTEVSEYYANLDTQFANNACIKAVVGTTGDEE